MAKTNTNPELRFAKFIEDWGEFELGEVAKFNPKHEIPDAFNYVDLESVVGTEMISYRKEYKISAPSRAQRLAEKGDVFYQTVRPYQKNNFLFDRDAKNFVFSTGYAQLRPIIESSFLFTLIQNDEFVRIVLNNCTGTSYPAINSSVLASIKQYFPKNKNEQQKIGNFFENIDKLIAEHQQKHEKLKALKKAMLSKMFPQEGQLVPEIRFKGFSEEWKFESLGLLTSVFDGTHQTPKYTETGVMFLSVENIRDLKSKKFISQKAFEEEFHNYPVNGDVLMTRIGDVGTANVVKTNEPIAYYVSLALLKKKSLDSYFLKECIESEIVRNDIWRRTLHIAFPKKINKNEIEKVQIPHPISNVEQELIGNYFKNLDELITNHKTQIKKLNNLKKAFLAKMFI